MADGKPNKNDPRDTPRRGRNDRCNGNCPPDDKCKEILGRIEKFTKGNKKYKGLGQRYNEQLTGRIGPPNELLKNNGRCAPMFGTGQKGLDAQAKYIANNRITANSYNAWAGELLSHTGKDRLGWCTHEERYNTDQEKLKEALDEWDDNDCGDDDNVRKARKWATQPAPLPSEWKDAKRQAGRDFFSWFIPGGAPVRAGKMVLKGAGKLLGGGGRLAPAH